MMETCDDGGAAGAFEARYLAFLETIPHLRPALHRYCARMTGSVLDGEDVVQDALFQAYRKLETYDDTRPLKPWLFRIAHNACIDFLRKRGVREDAEIAAAEPDVVPPVEPPGPGLGRAVERLVLHLPPMERACVLLKDVFDDTLEDVATQLGSTVGGVKAALNRARTKLASRPTEAPPRPARRPSDPQVLRLYVERFNARDWDGLRALIAADARLRVADRYAGPIDGSPYFGNYARLRVPWRLAIGEVDGEPAIVVLHERGGEWVPHTCVDLEIVDGRVQRIADYGHTPWLLDAAGSVAVL
jgi:RNA polymerase sigma-70 factor (ECF subfamily)